MEYENFKEILNKNIFNDSKDYLLKSIMNSPNRFVGLFRPTTPKNKIIQNISQSYEVRFGNAFEKLLENYFQENSFKILEKRYKYNNKSLNIDICFEKNNVIYFIEQKIRDDHDSTKKEDK